MNVQNDGHLVIYIDESSFTRETSQKRGWVKSGDGTFVTAGQVRFQLGVIAAVSEQGVEGFVMRKGTTNRSVFASFVIELATALQKRTTPLNGRKVILYLDNASYHMSPQVRELINRTIGTYIFAPAYCSFANPAETLFARLKKVVKKQG